MRGADWNIRGNKSNLRHLDEASARFGGRSKEAGLRSQTQSEWSWLVQAHS
jgi:hypothetical protein